MVYNDLIINISLKYSDVNLQDNNELAERIQRLEDSLQLVTDDEFLGRVMTDVNKTLQKLDQEMDDNQHGSSWSLGQSFSALDMFLAVIVHELSRLGYKELLLDKPNIGRFTQNVQLNPTYIEILGPLMNRDVSQLAETSGAFNEEETVRNSPLQEARKARKKASEDRSWYNLW